MSNIVYKEDFPIPIKVSEFSQAGQFNAYMDEDGKHYYFNILRSPNFQNAAIDPEYYTMYRTMPSETWPAISYKYYKKVTLWWLIVAFNKISNPLLNPAPGLVLKIPTKEAVRIILDTLNSSK